MVTSGSQASGDTGLNICTSGLIAVFTVADRPHSTPSGTARRVANMNPVNTVTRLVTIWSR